MDGQLEGREYGMHSSQWSPRKRCDIDKAKRWAQPKSREDSSQSFCPRRLDAIRDSRIACQRWRLEHSLIMFGIRGSQQVRSHADCERGVSANNLSQSEAALKLQISKRTLQEWEQDRAAPRGLARSAIEKAIRA